MSMPFDATMKGLLEFGPGDWLRLLGREATNVELIDADISTVSGATDKVILVKDEPGWVEQLEFQVGPDALKPRKLNVYNGILEDRHGEPVRTTLILLRKEANLSIYDGIYTRTLPGESEPYRTFRYNVVRVWQMPPSVFLQCPATMPLAPIADVPADQVPTVIDEMKQRMTQLPNPSFVGELWTATNVLMGMKYDEAFIEMVLREVQGMEESTTYQAIMRRGEAKGAEKGLQQGLQQGELLGIRELLIAVGQERFGTQPAPPVRAYLDAITDRVRLLELGQRVLHVESWDELIGSPPKRTRRKKTS